MRVNEKDRARLDHILKAIAEIESYTSEIDESGFQKSSLMQSAWIRQLEIIGEACNRISFEVREYSPHISWRQVIGLRNILIHQYFGVDAKVIWDILKEDLPEFKQDIGSLFAGTGVDTSSEE